MAANILPCSRPLLSGIGTTHIAAGTPPLRIADTSKVALRIIGPRLQHPTGRMRTRSSFRRLAVLCFARVNDRMAMFAMIETCSETVSLLRALTLGAGEACVEISLPSLISVLVPFIASVLVLQWLARRVLFGPPKRRPDPTDRTLLRTGQVLPRNTDQARAPRGEKTTLN